MQKMEYIIDGNLINNLWDFIMTFGLFFEMSDWIKSEVTKQHIKLLSNEAIKEKYSEIKEKDDNLNRFNDYLRCMANPMDNSIWEGDYILIRLLNSDKLRGLFWYEYTIKYYQENLKSFLNTTYTLEEYWPYQWNLKFDIQHLLAVQNYVRNTTIFDTLILNIITTKKIRLQLE